MSRSRSCTAERAAIVEIAACHQDRLFAHVPCGDGGFLAVDQLVDAGVALLDGIAPDVAEHFVRHVSEGASPPAHEFVRRLRADLSATSEAAQVR